MRPDLLPYRFFEIAFAALLASIAGCSGCSGGNSGNPKAPQNQSSSGAAEPVAAPPISFREIASTAGVEFIYRNGTEAGHSSILESLGGGAAVFDFDGDRILDLLFPGGGEYAEGNRLVGLPHALFRGRGGNKFERIDEQASFQSTPHYNHGAAVGDYDNDGFPDVLITGYGGLELWINQGDGTFREGRAEAGLVDASWSSSAAWGDLNGDSFPDLYVAHYVNWSFDNHPYCHGPTPEQREICPPKQYDPLPDVLYFNNGDGTFRDGSREAGLRTDGKGLGVLLADVEDDQDLDIYVANDTTDNFLYLNDGAGQFEEVGALRGVAVDNDGIANGSMGVDLCDFNRDGLFDLWVANYEREAFALYRNEGAAHFLHVSQPTGITALGGLFVGFGTACADFDRDGDEDMAVANGHVIKYPTASPRRQLPLLLANGGDRFERVSYPADNYFGQPHEGRGLALGDLDADGDLDVVVSHLNDPVAILENQVTLGGWLSVRLVGTVSARDAVGARLVLQTSAGDLVRQVKSGGSYLSHNDYTVYWGVPEGMQVEKLSVRWPSGAEQSVSPKVNSSEVLVEPAGGNG